MFIFLLVMTLLAPATMITFGVLWKKHPPKNRNYISGYRTPMSMKSDETWKFAHQYHAKIWLWSGIVLLILSTISMFLFKNNYELASLWIVSAQVVLMLLSLIPTEKALRDRFDRDGRAI